LCDHRLTYRLIGYNHLFGQNQELSSAKSVLVSDMDYNLYFLSKLGLAEWASDQFLCLVKEPKQYTQSKYRS
jgi:hypothetical protein